MRLLVRPAPRVRGKITLPGDKSIASRSLIVSAISQGKTVIENFPASKDCLATLHAVKALRVPVSLNSKKNKVTVCGQGIRGLRKPARAVFVADSGTTLRLMLGVLAGQAFTARLIAGKSLSARPMRRVTAPLRQMGARIKSRAMRRGPLPQEEYPPITITGAKLKAIAYKLPVASAQVKSAILFAGLYAQGRTQVLEPVKTRDHTERMLSLFGADIKIKPNKIIISNRKALVSPGKIRIPGDISSAGFFLVLAAISAGARLTLKNVSLNPTRSGIIKVLRRMGADIRVTSYGAKGYGLEPAGDITIKGSRLKGVTVRRKEIPSLIDELPVLMVAACFASGRTVFDDVGELRVKETDRIRSLAVNLRSMGAKLRIIRAAGKERVVIDGGKQLKGAKVRSFGDHRTAMSMVVAGMRAQGVTTIDEISCISKSFPDFLATLKRITPQRRRYLPKFLFDI